MVSLVEARARFWSKVSIPSTALCQDMCWEWAGAAQNGYGVFWLNGKNEKSHRVAYELTKGPIKEGFKILHVCDNSICCNPRHLMQGTNQDNSDDMVAKGRSAKGSKVLASHLTEPQVIEIRASSKGPTELAAKYGVTKSTISKIKLGHTWRHV